MEFRPHRSARAVLPAAIALAFPLGASAATYVVGTPVGAGQCTHANLQAAVNAAATNPGADTIRVTRSAAWTAQQVGINSDHDLEIVGGYANCNSTTADGTRTTLDGAGGDHRPVFTIRSNGIVTLRGLSITGGDQAGDDNGGGISFEGGGILDIGDSSIAYNEAHDGGGIYATGTSTAAELVLRNDVVVGFNVARNSGGGVVAKSLEASIIGPNTSLMFNEAHGDSGGGNGGGLAVVSQQFASYAYVYSDGIGGIGALYANTAVNGGGIAVLGGQEADRPAYAEVFSTHSDGDVVVNENTASGKGGGIYVKSDADDSSGDSLAWALLRNARIDGNSAPDGAAIYVDYDEGGVLGLARGGIVRFNVDADIPMHAAAAPCPFGRPCGFITGNVSSASGAVIRMPSDGDVRLRKIAVQDNEGGRLAYLTSTANYESPFLTMRDCLITGNAVANELLRLGGDRGFISLDHATIADNAIGTDFVAHSENLSFTRSLVYQPGKRTMDTPPTNEQMSLVVTNDVSLAGSANTYAAPRFVDPERGDYNLRAGSVAVDYAPSASGDEQGDLNSHTRNLDLPNIPNQAGAGDAGAFEREYYDPLVLNPDFDADLHLWDAVGSAEWDGTQNAVGVPGSGSLKGTLGIDDTRIAVRSQCVHLPNAGFFRLAGSGRASHGVPGHNEARLAWELRRNGGVFGCSDGAPDATGELLLAQDTTWHAATTTIEVPAALLTNNTSLTIYAVGINGNPVGGKSGLSQPDGGPDVWFDGITLTRVLDDSIFRNGFDAP